MCSPTPIDCLTRDAHFAHIAGLRSGQRLEDFLP